MNRILVTGGAGFIGSHVVDSLVRDQREVCVIDNFDSFYSRGFKESNISGAIQSGYCRLVEADIANVEQLRRIFAEWQPDLVIHLAARAGVRPSVDHPGRYIETNVNGTANVLDLSVAHQVKKVIFASSSSVYGLNKKVPFTEDDPLLLPASPYGATKIAGEALCQSYSNCYGLPIVALRFFTVYGPRQRPDLAIHSFSRKILRGEPISMFGDGQTCRDYTYVTDIVAGIRAAMSLPIQGYEVCNLGNDQPVKLIDLIQAIEEAVGKKAIIHQLPAQVGDVPATWASLDKASRLLQYRPQTSLQEGLNHFIHWLRSTGLSEEVSF